jgi:MFS family permease
MSQVMVETPGTANDINVTRLIDDGRLSRFQIGTIICCALVSALDGIDTQSIGVAAPFIADGLGFKVADFGPIFSAALLGATVGAATFGPLADRLGRKTLLIVACVLFGFFTILTASANSVPALMIFRVLAGVGLGGATPCFIALTSEYAPARLRATLVTVMWSAFPLGAMLGGLLNSYLARHLLYRRCSPAFAGSRIISLSARVDQVPVGSAQRRQGRRTDRRAFPLCAGTRRFTFCFGRKAIARCVHRSSVHRRPRTWNAAVMGSVFHGLWHLDRCRIVDARLVAAQRHLSGQYRVRRRL